MADVLTREQRRRNMSAIRGKDTKPELAVRQIVRDLGFGRRYRLHRKDLPGKPDLVFPRLRKIILVHGCFWHMHDCPKGNVRPAENRAYWDQKREGNVARDKRHELELRALGWEVLVLWACSLRDPTVPTTIRRFLYKRA